MSIIGRCFVRKWTGHRGIISSLQRPKKMLPVWVRHTSSMPKTQWPISVDERKITIWRESCANRYYNVWLRDHCQCEECLHGETRQRLLDILTIPKDIQAESVTQDDMGLRIICMPSLSHNRATEADESGQNDRHESYFSWSWLQYHSHNCGNQKHSESPSAELWGAGISKDPPVVQYEDVMASDKGVSEWTLKIRTFGFCYVHGCPVSSGKTQELLERIAFIRPTHYGGFYDFTSDLASKDTAYTSLALEAHTDTTYFSDPAGLQMFHLLSHIGSGGKSLLVDGFAAARILQKESPDSYDVLARKKIRSHASGNEGVSIQPFTAYPVFNHASDRGLYQIRWNSSDRATMDDWDDDKLLEQWYEAAWKWSEILRRPDLEYWGQLQPGKPLIFDNWRVLHGRSAFTGKRRICGGYSMLATAEWQLDPMANLVTVNYDDYMSRYRMTNIGREGVLQRL